MKNYFFSTQFIRVGVTTYSSGVIALEQPDLDALRKSVCEGLKKDGIEATPDQVVVLAFNPV